MELIKGRCNLERVCVLTTVHPAGDTRVYFKEVRSLVNAGFDVVYIAQDAEKLNDNDLTKVNTKKYRTRRKRIFSFIKIWKLALKQNAEMYHLQDPELIVTGLLLKMSGKKVIYDVHEDYPGYIRQKEYLNKFARIPLSHAMSGLEKLASVFFDYIFTADNLVASRFPKKKTEVLYNFPDLRVFKISRVSPEKEYDLIYPGSISRVMAESVIRTVKASSIKGYNVKTLIVSNFKLSGGKDWIKKRMNEEGIPEESIVLKDFVPYNEVALLSEKSKVGFIPLPNTLKFQKNIPTKLFEFMYCGIPVLATDLKPSRQFVDGFDCADFVDIEDADQTSDALIKLLNNPERCMKMGENGRKLVTEKYNWVNEERKLISVYKKLLEEG